MKLGGAGWRNGENELLVVVGTIGIEGEVLYIEFPACNRIWRCCRALRSCSALKVCRLSSMRISHLQSINARKISVYMPNSLERLQSLSFPKCQD